MHLANLFIAITCKISLARLLHLYLYYILYSKVFSADCRNQFLFGCFTLSCDGWKISRHTFSANEK